MLQIQSSCFLRRGIIPEFSRSSCRKTTKKHEWLQSVHEPWISRTRSRPPGRRTALFDEVVLSGLIKRLFVEFLWMFEVIWSQVRCEGSGLWPVLTLKTRWLPHEPPSFAKSALRDAVAQHWH
jgi:hypothetical protein